MKPRSKAQPAAQPEPPPPFTAEPPGAEPPPSTGDPQSAGQPATLPGEAQPQPGGLDQLKADLPGVAEGSTMRMEVIVRGRVVFRGSALVHRKDSE